jgi:DNA-binding CsgD family transcriptional regulator
MIKKERYFKLTKEGIEHLAKQGLSRREIEACEKLIMHESEQLAADSMFIDLKTIKYHKTAIYKKLGLKKSREIFLYLYEYIDVHYLRDLTNITLKPKRIIFPNPLPTGRINEH